MALPFIPTVQPVTEETTNLATEPWRKFFEGLLGLVTSLTTQVNLIPGAAQGLLVNAPAGLGVADAGRLYYITDYGHVVRWDGTRWTFAPGDVGNGFFRECALVPQADAAWWQECDGTTTDYLVVGGASLTTASFTTPNLKTGPQYLKSGGTYTGTLVGATAPTLSGSTGNGGAQGAGVTGDTDPGAILISAIGAVSDVPGGGANKRLTGNTPISTDDPGNHHHTTPALPDHAHGVGTLAASATGEPDHLVVRVFFRR